MISLRIELVFYTHSTHLAGFSVLPYLLFLEYIRTTELQKIFKCIKSIPPSAKNAIFNEIDKEGNLEYDDEEEDVSRPDDEQGYVSSALGDSGSPYWMKDHDGVATLIAIHHGGLGKTRLTKAKVWYNNDPRFQCQIIATKVTKEMLDWIKEKEQQYSNTIEQYSRLR